MKRSLAAILALACWLLWPRSALAHDPFELTTEAVVRADSLLLRTTMTPAAARRLLGGAPPEPKALATELFRVESAGQRLAPTSQGVTTNAESELELELILPAPRAGALRMEAAHLRVLPEGYLNSITLREEAPPRLLAQKVLHAGDAVLEIPWPPRRTSAAPLELEPRLRRSLRFLELGIRHVLGGYDHLLFLAGILVTCRRVRALLLLVSCFTVAHALTLGAAVLGGLDAPSRWVEPLIAASILFVGVENLRATSQPRARYAVTFGFGLIHGLGFASALREQHLGSEPLLPLLSFNVGVELAQLLIAAALLPPLWLLHRRGLAAAPTRALSLIVALAGAYWLVERTVLA